jgi:hypothetical protein
VYGPAETGTASAKAFESDVAAAIAAGQQAGTADLVGSLSSAYNLLAENQARAGSGVYFLTGGNRPALSNDEMERLSVVLGLFKQRQWAITGLQLPGTTEPVTDFLSRA